jgi:ribose-phosphate pyrophosphokinase
MGEVITSALSKEYADDVFLTSGYVHPELAQATANELHIALGGVLHRQYPNTEFYTRYTESVRGKHVIIMQPHVATEGGSVNDAIMQQLLMLDAAKSSSAREITAVIPNLGYARQDRKAKGREALSARVIVNQLASGGADRIVTIDMHSAQTQAIFNGPFDHLTAQPLLRSAVRNLIDPKNVDAYAVVAPDSGSVKMADYQGGMLGLDTIYMAKKRDRNDPSRIAPRALVPEAKDRTCILFDDMIDTAGTLQTAADALHNSGARRIYVAATQGVFSDPAFERLNSSPIDGIFVTDTVPMDHAKKALGDRLHVIPVAPMIGRALMEIVTNGSVSDLFNDQNHM